MKPSTPPRDDAVTEPVGILMGEALVQLREAEGRATALVDKFDAASNAMRAAKASDELQRQIGNCSEWARMLAMRAKRLGEKLAEGE